VQQHNGASLTRDLILDADPVDVYPAHPLPHSVDLVRSDAEDDANPR
jgi:hypothetical protein